MKVTFDIQFNVIYGLYLLILLILIIVLISTKSTRNVLTKIHSDTQGNHSWMRYGSTSILLTCIILIFTSKFLGEQIDSNLIMVLVGTIFAGKAAQTGINSDR